MPIKPEDFLELAKQLASRRDEASLRTAVNRAYYALFHNGRRIVKDFRPHWPVPTGPEVHKVLPDYLMRIGLDEQIPEFITLANEIKKLRRRRREADYDIDKRFMSQKEVINLIRRAENVKVNIRL